MILLFEFNGNLTIVAILFYLRNPTIFSMVFYFQFETNLTIVAILSYLGSPTVVSMILLLKSNGNMTIIAPFLSEKSNHCFNVFLL